MTTLQTVEFWPSTGDPRLAWLPGAAADSFVRSARRVCELYSEELRLVGLPATVSSCRFVVEDGGKEGTIAVSVLLDRPPGFEEVDVTLPEGLELLEPDVRAGLVLEVIHQALTRLAGERDWDRDVLDQVRRRVLRRRLRFTWASDWKVSPDHRLVARVTFDLEDDGFGRARVQVRDRDDQASLTETAEHLAYSTVEGFRRAAKSLRWRGSRGGVFQPSIDWEGRGTGEVVWSTEATTPRQPEPTIEPISAETGPAVPVLVEARRFRSAVTGDGDRASPDTVAAQVMAGGGGPINGVPRAYLLATQVMGEHLETDLASWWAPAGGLLYLGYAFGDVASGVFLRRTARETRVIIRRPTASLSPATATAQAHEDMAAAVARVAKRFNLVPDPITLTRQQLEAQVKAIMREELNHQRALRRFVGDVRHLLPDDIADAALHEIDEHSDVMRWLPLNLPLDAMTTGQRTRMRRLLRPETPACRRAAVGGRT